MIPTLLVARNYRCLDDLAWTISEGATAIVGPNGAGKSSRLLAIEHALFGPKSRSFAPLLRRGETEMQLELHFEHGGNEYRIRRGYSARGAGKTWVTFDEMIGEYVTLTQETAAVTNERICKTIGLSRETYRASAYSPQDDGAAWTSADPSERKRILAEILNLSEWDRLEAEAAKRRKVVHAEALKARGEGDGVESANAMLTALDERLGEARAADLLLAGREEGLAARMPELQRAAREAHTAAAQADARVEAARAAKATADAAREQRDSLIGRIDEAHDKLSGIEPAAAIAAFLPERERMLAEAREMLAADQASRADYLARENARDRLDDKRDQMVEWSKKAFDAMKVAESTYESAMAPDAKCPVCQQVIVGDAHRAATEGLLRDRDAAREQYKEVCGQAVAATKAWEEACAALGAEPEPTSSHQRIWFLEQQVAEARTAAQTVAAAEGWRSQLAAMEQEIQAVNEAIERTSLASAVADEAAENVAASLETLKAAEAALATANADDADIRRKRISTSTEVARLTAELDQARKRAEAAEAAAARAVELEQSLNVLSLLERAYGRDGVPSLIVETVALPAIQTEANRVLDDLASPFRVDLRAQRATKSGETREALDIIIHTPTGEAAYESLSGGEATRVNVALRIGLARLLATRRGAEVGIFALDEPDGLDAEGADRLAVILKDLARSTFGRVVLVSHVDGLRDSLDNTIVLTGENAEREPAHA